MSSTVCLFENPRIKRVSLLTGITIEDAMIGLNQGLWDTDFIIVQGYAQDDALSANSTCQVATDGKIKG